MRCSNCVPATGNQPDGARFTLQFSELVNVTPLLVMRLDCPIMKERVGTGITKASIFVEDNNPSADVACELWSEQVGPSGRVRRQGLTKTSSGSGGNLQELQLGSLPGVPGKGSFWFIGCNLVPFSRVLSYYVDEQQ